METHYHPDHIGLVNELQKMGIKLLLIDTQFDYVHFADAIFKREKHLRYEYETIIPGSWKYKVKNAISDIQIAVERTLLVRTIAVFYQMHPHLLNNAATQKYLNEREEKKLLPFSQKAFGMMSEAKDVSRIT